MEKSLMKKTYLALFQPFDHVFTQICLVGLLALSLYAVFSPTGKGLEAYFWSFFAFFFVLVLYVESLLLVTLQFSEAGIYRRMPFMKTVFIPWTQIICYGCWMFGSSGIGYVYLSTVPIREEDVQRDVQRNANGMLRRNSRLVYFIARNKVLNEVKKYIPDSDYQQILCRLVELKTR